MNIETPVIKKILSEKKEFIEYHVIGLDDWDFFDTLLEFFKKYYDAVVENKTDGIVSRSYQLLVRGEYFMLEHHDDIGNWFYSCNTQGDSILMKDIAADLESRLKNVGYE